MKKIREAEIPDWPGYLATEDGEIISIKFNKRRVLKLARTSKGYLRVVLCRNGYKKMMLVHRLVWQTFRGPIPLGKEVAHDDGNPGNNKLDNLKCITHKENCADKWRHGTTARLQGERNGSHTQPHRRPRGERHGSHTQPHRRPRGEQNGQAKLTVNQVQEIRALYETGDYLQRELAARFGVSQMIISLIVRGKTWNHVL